MTGQMRKAYEGTHFIWDRATGKLYYHFEWETEADKTFIGIYENLTINEFHNVCKTHGEWFKD